MKNSKLKFALAGLVFAFLGVGQMALADCQTNKFSTTLELISRDDHDSHCRARCNREHEHCMKDCSHHHGHHHEVCVQACARTLRHCLHGCH